MAGWTKVSSHNVKFHPSTSFTLSDESVRVQPEQYAEIQSDFQCRQNRCYPPFFMSNYLFTLRVWWTIQPLPVLIRDQSIPVKKSSFVWVLNTTCIINAFFSLQIWKTIFWTSKASRDHIYRSENDLSTVNHRNQRVKMGIILSHPGPFEGRYFINPDRLATWELQNLLLSAPSALLLTLWFCYHKHALPKYVMLYSLSSYQRSIPACAQLRSLLDHNACVQLVQK